MNNSITDQHLKYIKEHLINQIVASLKNESLETYEAEHSGGLDGFMSALYNIRLRTKTELGLTERVLIAKFMKGDHVFRQSSKSYIQFANEVYIYANVLPAYKKILEEAQIRTLSVDDWVASAFVAKYGHIEGLSLKVNEIEVAGNKGEESVLVLENLKPLGYTLGPRLYLKSDHLLGMCKVLGQYHALSYVLRFQDPVQFDQLKRGIIPLPFHTNNDVENNIYGILYRAAFDRFFEFYDRQNVEEGFDKFMKILRSKYFTEPTMLLEDLRVTIEHNETDSRFGAILHGDFNRNNVLFHYKEHRRSDASQPTVGDVCHEVDSVKMIDFQEVRYGSPAIDLSFFMYMNTPPEMRIELWDSMLRVYHDYMSNTMVSILKVKNADLLEHVQEKYSFNSFTQHFERFAFYGVLICMHFLPWMLCSKDECSLLSNLFETDMNGKAFHKISVEAGGDNVNQNILDIVKHSYERKYLENLIVFSNM